MTAKHLLFAGLSALAFSGASAVIPLNNMEHEGRPVLVPEVREYHPSAGVWAVPQALDITAPAGNEQTVTTIRQAFRQYFPQTDTASGPTLCRLELTDKDIPDTMDGYTLRVDTDGIRIAARRPSGLFYGAQTLANLLRNSPDGLRHCFIRDYERFSVRGVYLNLRDMKAADIPAFKQAVDLYAALKYNTLVIQLNDNIPLKDNPFTLRKTPRLTEAELRDILDYVRARYFDVIPTFQALSHAAWIFMHPDHKNMLEGSYAEWYTTVCPSSEQGLELTLKIIRETIDLIKPKYFNLNLDEIYLCPWQKCDKCKARNGAELLGEYAKKLEKVVYGLGVTPIFAQDSFCPEYPVRFNPDNPFTEIGTKALDYLDRRDVLAYWEYTPYPPARQVEYFTSRGFRMIGMSYCRELENVEAMPKLIAAQNGLGCYFTYWSYMHKFMNSAAHNAAWAGTVLAGNYQWNPDATPMSRLYYDPGYEMRRLREPGLPVLRPGSEAASVPLDGCFNTLLGNDEEFPLFKDGKELELIKAILAAAPERFALRTNASGNRFAAIVLSGSAIQEYPADAVVIPVGIAAKSLAFLMTSSRPTEAQSTHEWRKLLHQAEVGELTVRYEDGSDAVIPLRYRYNLMDWNNDTGAYALRNLFRGEDARGARCNFSVLDFVSPKPEKVIKEIVFSSRRNEGIAPALLAVSAIEPAGKLKSAAAGIDRLPESPFRQYRDDIYADFSKGLVPAVFLSSGVFAAAPRTAIVDCPDASGRKMLKITLTPQQQSRVYVDIPFPADPERNFLRFSYSVSSQAAIDRTSVYLAQDDWAKHNEYFNFQMRGGTRSQFSLFEDWNEVYLPLSLLKKVNGGIDPAKPLTARISFWLQGKEEVTVCIGPIGSARRTGNSWRAPLLPAWGK